MKSEIIQVIEQQRDFFDSGQTKIIKQRILYLKKLKKVVQENKSLIIDAVYQDLKRPEFETVLLEINTVLKEIDHMVAKLPKYAKKKKAPTPLLLFPSKSYTQFVPRGCTLVISPWNYPIQLTFLPLIGAIATGNTCIVKPSEHAKKSQGLLIKLINENFPPELIFAADGALEESKFLLEQKFDFIFFTGSTHVGKIVMQAAAKHLTPVCLELGGKSPCIVGRDANLKTAARRIVWGKFINAGQTCVAPDYLLVPHNKKEELIKHLKQEIENAFGQNPQESECYGRIINKEHFLRLNELIGNNDIEHGGVSDEQALYIAPTLLSNVCDSDPIMRDEIFGPILPILEYDKTDQLIKIIKSRSHPLALYIFSDSEYFIEEIFNSLEFGGGCINDCIVHLGNSSLPFGGIGNSGIGKYHGRHSFETFSHHRSIMKNTLFFDLPLRYAPFKNIMKRCLSWLYHFQ
jgi:aldehyde dehydrogenase (NAD+)